MTVITTPLDLYDRQVGKPNKELRLYLAHHFAVKCRHCDVWILDPDKTKGQTYLKGKCPTCRKHSNDPKSNTLATTNKLTKRERKIAAKEAKRAAREAKRAARGKYTDVDESVIVSI
jgi:phage FluMu protein Com